MRSYFFHSQTGFYYMILLYYISIYYILVYCISPTIWFINKKCERIVYDFLVYNLNMKRYYALKVVVTGQLMVLASFISGIAYYLHRNIPVYYDNAVVWFLKTIYCNINTYYDNAVWFLKTIYCDIHTYYDNAVFWFLKTIYCNINTYYDNAVWFLKTIYCSIHPYYDNAVVWFLKIMDSWPKW